MSDITRSQKEAYSVATNEARVAAQRAREAAEAFDAFAELLMAGDYAAASQTHLHAVEKLAAADEAAATCDDWLMKSAEPS